jgi:integrase/recombinase XerD
VSTLALPAPNLGGFQNIPPLQQCAMGFLARQKNKNTRVQYTQMLETFLKWSAAADVDPLNAVETQILMYLVWLQDPAHKNGRGYSESTVASYWTVVRGFYKHALRSRLIIEDPTTWIDPPPVDLSKQRRTFLPPTAFARFMEAAEAQLTPREYAVIAVLGMRGLRIAEACALNVDSMRNVQGQRSIVYVGKGGKYHDQILPIQVAWAIDQALGGRTEGPVLLNARGNRLTRKNADGIIKKTAALAGVDTDVSPHSMRRSFVTSGVAMGITLDRMQQTMGHADPKTTLTYFRLQGAHGLDESQNIASHLTMMRG